MNTDSRTDLPTPPSGWLMTHNPQSEPRPVGFGGASAQVSTATQVMQPADSPMPLPIGPSAITSGDNTSSSAPLTKRESVEMWLGQNAASIIAAILVFTGIFLLGSAVFPHLPNGGRVAFMFGISGALTAIGCVLELRKGNGLTLALMCCGMASLFVSVLVMRFYFGVVSEAIGLTIVFALMAIRLLAGKRMHAPSRESASEQQEDEYDDKRYCIMALVFATVVALYECTCEFPGFSDDVGALGAAILGAVYLVMFVGFGIMLMRVMSPSSAGVVSFAVACTMLSMSYLRCCTPLAGEESAWSVCCMACALVCAVIGFKMNVGGLRLYGLILTLTCVVKLVVFDAGGSGAFERAMTFMVGGFICFAISALYNYAVKRLVVPEK